MRLVSEPVMAVSGVKRILLTVEKIGQHAFQYINKFFSGVGHQRNVLALLAGQKRDHYGVQRKPLVEVRQACVDIMPGNAPDAVVIAAAEPAGSRRIVLQEEGEKNHIECGGNFVQRNQCGGSNAALHHGQKADG